MIDNLTMRTIVDLPFHVSNKMDNNLPFTWNDIYYFPNRPINGIDVYNWTGTNRNLRQTVSRCGKFTVANSIHKYSRGNNWDHFTFDDFKKAIIILSNQIGINLLDASVKKMEWGINVFEKPDYDLWIKLVSNPVIPMLKGSKKFGAIIKLTDYWIKQYDKSFEDQKHGSQTAPPGIVRIEKVVKHLRHLPYINKVSDIMKKENQLKLVNDLSKTVERITLSIDYDKLETHEISTVATVTTLKAFNSLNKRAQKDFRRRYKAIRKRLDSDNSETLSERIREIANNEFHTCNILEKRYMITS